MMRSRLGKTGSDGSTIGMTSMTMRGVVALTGDVQSGMRRRAESEATPSVGR